MDEQNARSKEQLTERISTWLRSKFSSVRVERRKTICALTMVWMLGLAVPSMAGVRALVEASVMRRPPRPPPRAVLEDLRGEEEELWDNTDRGRLEQRAAEIPWRTRLREHASSVSSSDSNLVQVTGGGLACAPRSPHPSGLILSVRPVPAASTVGVLPVASALCRLWTGPHGTPRRTRKPHGPC